MISCTRNKSIKPQIHVLLMSLASQQGFKACASGYSEAVKRHLAYLVHLLGGTLTDTLRRINTHLFVPCRAGPKYASVVKCVCPIQTQSLLRAHNLEVNPNLTPEP